MAYWHIFPRGGGEQQVFSKNFAQISTVTKLSTVTGLTANSVGAKSVTLSWDKIKDEGVGGYIIYKYNPTSKNYERIMKTKTLAASYTVKNLSPGESYKFAVKAWGEIDGQEVQSITYPVISLVTKLEKVSGLTAKTSDSWVKLSWGDVKNSQGYIVYKYDDAKKKWSRIAKTSSASLTVKNLSANKSYKFAVRAYTYQGQKEILSENYPVITANMKLSKVSGFKAKAQSATSVKLSWKKVTGAKGYIIYRYDTSSKTWKRIKKTSSSSCEITISKLKPTAAYKFAVKGYKTVNGQEIASYSYPQASVTTLLENPKVTAVSQSRAVKLSWKKVSGASGYQVYKKAANGKWEKLKTTSSLSFTVKNLEASRDYNFKIRAYKKSSGKTIYSDYTAITAGSKKEYLTVSRYANIYKSAKYASSRLGSVAKGNRVLYIGTSGRWIKIKTGNITGYVYNKAFGTVKNTSGAITKAKLPAAADDILFEIGTSPLAIKKYVTNNLSYYSRRKGSSRDDMVVTAMNYRSGSCYYYAAYVDYLLERAGYEHIIVDGSCETSYYAVHNWNLYKTSAGWRHLDATPFLKYSPMTFCGWTDSQLKARRNFYWDSSKYPAAK